MYLATQCTYHCTKTARSTVVTLWMADLPHPFPLPQERKPPENHLFSFSEWPQYCRHTKPSHYLLRRREDGISTRSARTFANAEYMTVKLIWTRLDLPALLTSAWLGHDRGRNSGPAASLPIISVVFSVLSLPFCSSAIAVRFGKVLYVCTTLSRHQRRLCQGQAQFYRIKSKSLWVTLNTHTTLFQEDFVVVVEKNRIEWTWTAEMRKAEFPAPVV